MEYYRVIFTVKEERGILALSVFCRMMELKPARIGTELLAAFTLN
jgi:hypothetical protein